MFNPQAYLLSIPTQQGLPPLKMTWADE